VWLYLLLAGGVRFYGYGFFEPEARGSASKALGGLFILAVLPLLYYVAPTIPTLLVLYWLAFESLQVFLCSAWYMVEPWEVPVGQSICSAKLGFDMGAVGILIVAMLLWRLSTVNSYRVPSQKGSP
jgi:hypothetical protein